MLTIRLARIGKKNQAQFQIVLQEHSVAPGGRHVEVLGSYDPHQKKTVLKEERIKYWLSQGAQPSDTAYNLLVSKGILTGEKRKVKLPKKAEVVVEEVKAEAPKKEETPVAEEIKTETPVETPKEEAPVVEEKKEEVKVEEVKTEEKVEEVKEEVKIEEAKAE